MFRKTILTGATLAMLGACAAQNTQTPTTEAEKLKVAAAIAEMTSDPKMIDQMFESMKAAAMPNLANICSAMPGGEQAACSERSVKLQPLIEQMMGEAMDDAKSMMPEMMNDMTTIMADVYTGPELARMLDFYASPEGKAIMKKQPEVMAQYMPKVMSRMQSMQVDMMKNMRAGIEKLMKDEGLSVPTDSPI